MKMSLFDMLAVLALGERKDGINPLIMTYRYSIRQMTQVGTKSTGFVGGTAAFMGVDDVYGKTKDKRQAFIKNGLKSAVEVNCPEHGIQPIWIGHIFPRVLGGVMVLNSTLNVFAQCAMCNQVLYSTVTPAQVTLCKRTMVEILTPPKGWRL